MIPQAEVHWHITDRCNYGCDYCPTRYKAGKNNHGIDEYLSVVRKLQDSRYKHAESIKWKIGGGEPLSFDGLSTLLKEIKKKPATIRLDTSGGDTWFNFAEVKELVDSVKLTHHHWQNISVLEFIIDTCAEAQKPLYIMVPLTPGRVKEDKALVASLVERGINAKEQELRDEHNNLWPGYSRGEMNIIMGLPEDWVPPPPTFSPSPPYIDLRVAPEDGAPSYTGKPCFAGVDYIFISGRGYVNASDCGGREIKNVFEADWEAPDASFACPMLWCRSHRDRSRIRMG